MAHKFFINQKLLLFNAFVIQYKGTYYELSCVLEGLHFTNASEYLEMKNLLCCI